MKRSLGIFNLIIPIGNEGDVKELPEQVRSGVTFTYADTYNDVAYTLFDDVKARLEQRPNFTAPKSEYFKVKAESDAKPKAKKAKSEKAGKADKAEHADKKDKKKSKK